jgi:penicillin-binding protein 1C
VNLAHGKKYLLDGLARWRRQGWGWVRAHPWRAGWAGLLSLVLLLDWSFPPPLPRDEPGLVVVASDGTPLRSWPDADGVWRYPVTPEQVSPHYLKALIGYEDRWFYWHPGVNPFALVRAAWQWARYGHIVSGGSTLTMQVARIIEPPGRTVVGKLRQILRALQLEMRLSKRGILTLYLNHAPMGGIVEGVEMASRTYLGKPSMQLSEAEAAMLVVLPQTPSVLRPDRNPDKAQRARDKVLSRMADFGSWSQATVDDARIERVGVNPLRAHWLAPLAAERLHQAARNRNGKLAQSGSAVIHTTLDTELQTILERILADRLGQLPPRVSMAALVVETDTLKVRAYAGSADFNDARRFSQVDMVRGVRSPGSTLKPFLYGMALDEGLIHSESLLADVPQSFGGYSPGNFQANFSGPVSAAEALQRSLNVPAVDLLDRLGPLRFAARLRAAGLRLRMAPGTPPNLSLILGGAGTTLEELVGAYRALARGGLAGQPRLTEDDPIIESRVMSTGAAYIIRNILENGGRPDRPFDEGGLQIAWKTGTSFGFRDAWAVGVIDGYTLGVWVGRPDGTPNPGFFGANVAAPLLKDIASALPRRPSDHLPRPPAGVRVANICWPLGGDAASTAPQHCHVKRSAWVLNGTIPPTLPDRIRTRGQVETLWVEPGSGLRTTLECNPAAQAREVARWPALLEPWLSAGERQRYGLPAWSPNCVHAEDSAGLRLTGLDSGSLIRAVPGQHQALVTVRGVGGSGTLYWLLDGTLVAAAPAGNAQNIRLSTDGAHVLTLMDETGHYDSVSFNTSLQH